MASKHLINGIRNGAAASLLLVTADSAAAGSAGIESFLRAYECPVSQRLALIHERGDRQQEDSRFLLLSVDRAGPGYVQCAFYDDDRQMMCEAESGYFSAEPGAPQRSFLPAAKVAKLGRLGFSTDASQGNFQRNMDTGTSAELRSVARLLLSALYEAYGARLDEPIEVDAPLLPEFRPTLDQTECLVG